MKLSCLYEYLDVAQSSFEFYGDPKGKAKSKVGGESNLSLLTGGHEDRSRFLKNMQGGIRKKKKKSETKR